MKSFNNFTIIFLFSIYFSNLHAQIDSLQISKIDTFKINFENVYELNAINFIPFSEKVGINNRELNSTQYKINLENNSLSLSDTIQYSIFDTLFVQYNSMNFNLKKNYKNRSLIKYFDNNINNYISTVKTETVDLSAKSIFGKELKSNGTLLRGFTFGSNKDLEVNSGLRLQLAGKISDEIEIVAALTDENTPIQPEGNTERLEELDKVFIEIKHKNANAVFGDYNLKQNIGEFGKVERKLQGVVGNFNIENYNGSVSFASSRGKFNSMQFAGIDGVQGPYRLSGTNGENDIIVIAGSEKIYLDGRQLKRGENNDYIIEYSIGEITFTPKILITSLSRITIDFEYTNRQYDRNTISANAQGNFFSNKLKFYINAIQEGDNKNSPIDFTISDESEQLLIDAGDNQLLAAQSGIIQLEGDSLGLYYDLDSLINGENYKIFIYSPGSENAKFNIVFSYVGENNGNYIRESIGKFKFVGINKGAYLPIRLLPLPEKNQLANFVFDYSPIEKININLELAGSSYDKNTFSSVDDKDNNGFARNLKFKIEPIDVNLFETYLGKISSSYRDRLLNKRFKSIDRINEIEFERNYNTKNSTLNEEILREFLINFNPVESIDFIGQYGNLKKGNNFSSERIYAKTNWRNYKNTNINYEYDFVNSDNSILQSDWLKQNGEISYQINMFQPGFSFRSEDKNENKLFTDSLLNSSLKYFEYSPFLNLSFENNLIISAKYTFTKESSPLDGIMEEEAKSYAHTYSLNWNEFKEFSTLLDFTFRNKKYSDKFSQLGFGDNETILLRSQSNINLLDRFFSGNIYYNAASERSAKYEKVYIRVTQGTGMFSYQGDLNNNGIADENEYIIDPYEGDYIQTTLPTDELFPVIDLKINSRFQIDFAKQFDQSNLFNTILNSLFTETTFRIEENSKITDTRKIYLLNFNYFLNDSLTLRGTNYFQQDLHILKNQRDLSFRLRFTETKNLNQYSSGLEKSFLKERNIRIKFRMVDEVNNETEFINKIENVFAPVNTNRSRFINSNELKTDFSYRPYNNIELGFLIKVGRLEDKFPTIPTILDENKLNLRLTLSLLEKGRLRFEIERTELLVNTNENIIPFEITNGNLIGKNYIWRTNFDYRFTGNLQTNINYSGRLQGKGKVINTLRAEARAYF
ncbi:MAG: hypothetical protein IPM32_14125 [Ignavibacteriae bacterium]|nr:hypothetical protein [Ignavibacteriota bacterium]